MNAQRDIRGKELDHAAHEFEWLINPERMPDEALRLNDHTNALGNGYTRIAEWMTLQSVDQVARAHEGIDFADAAAAQGFGPADIPYLRETVLVNTHQSYSPGFHMIGKIQEIVPHIAHREGITDRSAWGEIAWQARKFGALLTSPNTKMQVGFSAAYIDVDYSERGMGYRLDPRAFKLDANTGITTINPFKEVKNIVMDLQDYYYPERAESRNNCIALNKPGINEKTLFDDYWKAFTSLASHRLHPGIILPKNPAPAYEENITEFQEFAKEIISRQQRFDAEKLIDEIVANADGDLEKVIAAIHELTGADPDQLRQALLNQLS